MITYLVEEWNEKVIFEDNSNIIALNPNVCYQLDKVGIKYQIIEDYYSENELLEESKVHFSFKSQLKWFEEFDIFLQEQISKLKELHFRMGYWYFIFLKNIIDTVILESIILDRFFEKTKQSTIIHVAPESNNCKLDHRLYLKRNDILLQLIPLFCEKYSVSYDHVEPDKFIDGLANCHEITTPISAIEYIKKTARSNKIILNLYNIYRSECWRNIARPSSHPSKKLNILMLKLNWGGDLFVRDALARGHNIYLKSDNTIYKYTAFGLKKHYIIPTPSVAEFFIPWQNASKQLVGNLALFEWINVHCGVDVSGIFTTLFNHFISVIAPELFCQFNAYLEFYGECGIDFTMTPHEASISEIAAVAAARHHKDTKPVCFMHGYTILETDLWDITDMDHHDVYFVPEREFYDYFIGRKQLYNGQKTELFEGFGIYEWQNCMKIKENREKKRKIKRNRKDGKKQTIIYLPTFFAGGYTRIDSIAYSDTWYYTFQKELLKYFSTKSDINFIWKGLPQSESIYNPIPKYIDDMGFENIRVATDPFINHLSSADKVILDYPSTGLFESAIAGVPVMSLYHKNHRVRKDAVDFFGDMVQPFSTIQEALEKVDEFLKNDPKRYCKEISLSKNDIVGILENQI